MLVFPITVSFHAKVDISSLGKQLIYHALQDPKDSVGAEELSAMDQEVIRLREEVNAAKIEEKALRTKLTAVNASMTIDDYRSATDVLEHDKKALTSRLEPLRAGTTKPVEPKEKEEVEREWKLWTQRANGRKKIAMELWDVITEPLSPDARYQIWV